MKVVGFKAYFGDGSTYSSKQGEWKDAPAPQEGIQIVNIYFEDGFVYHWAQHDHYTLDVQADGTPLFMGYYLEDEDGNEYLVKDAKRLVRHGKTVPTATFKAIEQKANQEVDWAKA